MIKTPLSTVIGGAGIWTPEATIIGGTSKTLNQLIKSLFANSEQGVAYDPNDLSTMWQDQAKLLPVTGEGQPVWHILDKSGNNNHAFATSSATRPILRKNATTGAYYLEFDGSDDFLVTSSINFTATDKISLFAGVRKLSDATIGVILSSTGGNGAFEIYHPAIVGNNDYVLSATGSTGAKFLVAQRYAAPHSSVLSAKINIGQDLRLLSVNGTKIQNTTDDLGTGKLGNYPLYIGRRGGTSLPFNGHIYSLIGVARLSTDVETTNLEKAIAKNVGVTL